MAAAVACDDGDSGQPCAQAGLGRCLVEDNASQLCGPDGKFLDPVPCGEDQQCRSGRCLRRICEPGEFRCAVNVLEFCSLGTDWIENITCAPGTICNASLGRCARSVGEPIEICDGRDNDSDGETDEETEGPLCPVGRACVEGGCTPPDLCDGMDNDEDGETDEDGGCPTGLECKTGFCAGPEICDGLDNDEDGETDEDAFCDLGGQCIAGVCS